MKWVLVLLFPLTVWAGSFDCVDKLTDEGLRDTFSLTLNLDVLDPIFTQEVETQIEQAKWIARATVDYVGCDYKNDIDFGDLPYGLLPNSKCFYLNQKAENGLTCNIESDLGKFLIYWDDFSSVHIIYSRWD